MTQQLGIQQQQPFATQQSADSRRPVPAIDSESTENKKRRCGTPELSRARPDQAQQMHELSYRIEQAQLDHDLQSKTLFNELRHILASGRLQQQQPSSQVQQKEQMQTLIEKLVTRTQQGQQEHHSLGEDMQRDLQILHSAQ